MYRLKKLPYKREYITLDIYKYLSDANYSLGELKGCLDTSPYLGIILRLINMYEAKNSCDIADLKSTFKDIFIKSISQKKSNETPHHIINHVRSINILYRDILIKNKLDISDINNIQRLISPDSSGLRMVRGHKIYNKITNKVLYIPPQDKNKILEYYENLISYINEKHSKYDPLIKMAIVHYQFECIHPYKDGNGRVGRIINSMSLVQSKRLNYPIINLSKYLNDTREEYFYLLDKCHNDINQLDEFIIYILKGINETSKFTISFIEQISRIITAKNKEIIEKLPKIHSEKLVNHIFKYPFTKNELLKTELNISRSTASKYLKLLEDHGFVKSYKNGKEILYKNTQFANLFI